jgi:MoxR-like ATPase
MDETQTEIRREKRDIEHVFDEMLRDEIRQPALIAGDTGIGKTTFVRQISQLLGIDLLTLEAPTIIEEEIINLTYVDFSPIDGTKSTGRDKIDLKNARPVLAKSHLGALLEKKTGKSDEEYLQYINSEKAPAAVRFYYKQFGGTADTIPDEIQQIRDKFNCILFVDELLRKKQQNIGNVLRGLLNRMIGNDKLPDTVFPLYASNLEDVEGTIEPQNLNQVSTIIQLAPPTKAKFMRYVVSNAEEAGHPLSEELKSILDKELSNENISFRDLDNEIRTSPRRWEEIIKYLQAADELAFEQDKTTALKSTLASIESMFKNEKGEKSSLHDLADRMARDLFSARFKIPATDSANSSLDWEKTLLHQLQVKMKLGNYRKYVPIVMGAPGIGKTTEMVKIAGELGLLYITIAVDTLSTDELTGIPLPDPTETGFETKFAIPNLLRKIHDEMARAKTQWLEDQKVSQEVRDQRKKEIEWKEKHKQPIYLLLLDEFNRPGSVNTFNALRRVILDKKFTDDKEIPEEVIMVAALNPIDKDVKELTGHMKDAVDLIDGQPSWTKFIDLMKKKYQSKFDLKALEIIEMFANTFTQKVANVGDKSLPVDSLKFFLEVGSEQLWMSPRQYEKLLGNLSQALKRAVDDAMKHPNINYAQEVVERLIEKFDQSLTGTFHVHEVGGVAFINKVNQWLKNIGPKIVEKVQTLPVNFELMMNQVLENPTLNLKDTALWATYSKQYNRVRYIHDLTAYIKKLFDQQKSKLELLKSNIHKRKILDPLAEIAKAEVITTTELVSTLEHIHNELYNAYTASNMGDIGDATHEVFTKALHAIADDSKEVLGRKVEDNWDIAAMTAEREKLEGIMKPLTDRIGVFMGRLYHG